MGFAFTSYAVLLKKNVSHFRLNKEKRLHNAVINKKEFED